MRTPTRSAAVLAVLLTGQFMANVDIAVVNVAAPSIHTGLSASGAALQLVVSGYVLAYAALLVTGARLGAMFGFRRLFLLGLAGFTLASLACGLAPDAPSLIAARVVQGVGAALMTPQVLTGIQRTFEGAARARALGAFVMTLSGSAIVGQALGGLLVSANLFGSGWRPVFLVNVPIGAVLIPLALRWLPAEAASATCARLDLRGAATLALAALTLTLPPILGRELSWPAWTWICLLAAGPALAAFVAVERRIAAAGGSPLVDLRLLARPTIAWSLGAQALSTATYFAELFVIALYLQQGLGHDARYSGLALVAWVAAFGVAGAALRRVPASLAPAAPALGCALLAGAHLAIALSLLAGATDGPLLFGLLGCGGLGLGLCFGGLVGRLTGAVAPDRAADMSGLISMTSQLSGVGGVAAFGTLFLALAPHGGRDASIHAYTVVSIAFALTAALAATAAWRAARASAPATAPGTREPLPEPT